MRLFATLLLLATAACASAQTAPKPIEIKVVVIAMFEQGADTGDVPGEYQYWVEREHLSTPSCPSRRATTTSASTTTASSASSPA